MDCALAPEEVVALASPGLGDGESEVGSFGHEGGFANLQTRSLLPSSVVATGPSLHSGFRHAAQTPRKRLNFGGFSLTLVGYDAGLQGEEFGVRE